MVERMRYPAAIADDQLRFWRKYRGCSPGPSFSQQLARGAGPNTEMEPRNCGNTLVLRESGPQNMAARHAFPVTVKLVAPADDRRRSAESLH